MRTNPKNMFDYKNKILPPLSRKSQEDWGEAAGAVEMGYCPASHIKAIPSKPSHENGIEELIIKKEEADEYFHRIFNELGILDWIEGRVCGIQGLNFKISYYKYFRGYTIKELTHELGYSYSHTKRLHQQFLSKISDSILWMYNHPRPVWWGVNLKEFLKEIGAVENEPLTKE